jgi:PilZ domain
MLRRIQFIYDRIEERRNRRFAVPVLLVGIDGREFKTTNWSIGGFLIEDCDLPCAAGDTVTGTFRAGDKPPASFAARVIRRDAASGALATEFTDLSPEAFTLLDRAVARRLAGRSL